MGAICNYGTTRLGDYELNEPVQTESGNVYINKKHVRDNI